MLEGISSGLRLSLDLDAKLMRVGFLDLAENPIFHLKDNQANIFAVEQKIRFVSVDLRQLPAEVVSVRLGHPFEELVEPCGQKPWTRLTFKRGDIPAKGCGVLVPG